MKRKVTRLFLVASLVIAATLCIWTQTLVAENMTAAEAKNHIGETATVCGEVASMRYAASSRGQPTFINLDKPYPNQIFTVVIWGSDRAKFGEPENTYRDKSVCVTGRIREYRGVPEVVASGPGQIKVRVGREK
jgi:DNA/RNA endonuclease YhcR with UshA esterase domain